MLGQFWLLAILASLALGVPISQESATSSLTLIDLSRTKVSYGPTKMGLNKANRVSWNLKGENERVGSKVNSTDPVTQAKTSTVPKKMGLNRANKASWNLDGQAD